MSEAAAALDKYQNSAILAAKALAKGDYKTANRQAKIQNKILKRIESEDLDKNILVKALNHEYIGVSTIAAIDLLRINYEVKIAEERLERITKMDESKMGIDEKLKVLAAKIQLKNWKEKGYVNR